ncbi:hypothetical protein MCEME17_00270 [Candidatus Pelagibacterales bacterium]|jgi:hypothetical protein
MKLIKQFRLLASLLIVFFFFSQLAKAENRYFYQLGYGYVEGNSHSTFVSPNSGQFGGNIQGYRADLGLGLSSEINKIKVDYILSYSPDAFNNQVDTKNSCPVVTFECRINIKDSIDLGVKIYLPVEYNNITPAIYLGLSNADIQLKTFNRGGGNITMMSHQRNWGAAAGASLNYPLKEYNVDISLDYSWTAYEGNIEEVSTVAERSGSRPEIHLTSIKVKKYF